MNKIVGHTCKRAKVKSNYSATTQGTLLLETLVRAGKHPETVEFIDAVERTVSSGLITKPLSIAV